MKLYSYVVARDYGFAPNPFFGVCTLATCKPNIRKGASVGDWVVGTGSKTRGLGERVVYAMKVSEVLTYNQYWQDPRFLQKRPHMRGSIKQAFGDNIYHQNSKNRWIQINSHHSHPNGRPNGANIKNDTQSHNVLIGVEFVYWGATGPQIPKRFCRPGGNICAHRGHKCNFSPKLAESFVGWIQSRGEKGYAGKPAQFPKQPKPLAS